MDIDQENKILIMLYMLLYSFIFAIVVMILLLLFGIVSFSPGYGFFSLILIPTFIIWGYIRRLKLRRREQLEILKSKRDEFLKLPKVYDFFCPHCLYQTNDSAQVCPNCGVGKLSPTSKYQKEQK